MTDRPPQPDLHARVGTTPRQYIQNVDAQAEHVLEETHLASDHVIVDHNDPLGTKYQFLGESPPAKLPIGGSGRDPRTPEEVFGGVEKPQS